MLAIAAMASPVSAGENGPSDWEYGTFEYSVNIAGDDTSVAVLVGPAFPDGIRLLRDFKTLSQFQADLIHIVDALNAAPSPALAKSFKLKAKKRH